MPGPAMFSSDIARSSGGLRVGWYGGGGDSAVVAGVVGVVEAVEVVVACCAAERSAEVLTSLGIHLVHKNPTTAVQTIRQRKHRKVPSG